MPGTRGPPPECSAKRELVLRSKYQSGVLSDRLRPHLDDLLLDRQHGFQLERHGAHGESEEVPVGSISRSPSATPRSAAMSFASFLFVAMRLSDCRSIVSGAAQALP